jgi:hypothetical protein
MARHLLSHPENLWSRHVSLYSTIFSEALVELSKSDSISGDENNISEKLCPILSGCCYKHGKLKNHEIQTPYWEAPIQPISEEELMDDDIIKRPDFTCRLVNPMAESIENYEISLHIECKRLGYKTSANWILNQKYVTNGIKRFDNETHKYGKRADSGIMIGYIISMTPEEIESEVNIFQKKHIPENRNIKFTFDSKPLFKSSQDIERKYVVPTHFKLLHLWIDLRDVYKKM